MTERKGVPMGTLPASKLTDKGVPPLTLSEVPRGTLSGFSMEKSPDSKLTDAGVVITTFSGVTAKTLSDSPRVELPDSKLQVLVAHLGQQFQRKSWFW